MKMCDNANSVGIHMYVYESPYEQEKMLELLDSLADDKHKVKDIPHLPVPTSLPALVSGPAADNATSK